MSFPPGGFKNPNQERKGRYSGATRDFLAEMSYEERDPDAPYEETLDMLDDPENIARFEKCWRERISGRLEAYEGGELQPWAIAQSHMDIAWLWRMYQIVEKSRITHGKAAFHVLNVPGFKFTFSQPLMLEWLEKAHPDVFQQVKLAIETGRFELQGGDYVETDGKMPSGESFCRSRLYGGLFYEQKFGKVATVGWLPDSFGYNNNIPQFLEKSGCKYFYTQKITGNWPPDEFPFAHFKWCSPDGSEVIVYSNNFQFRPFTRWGLFGHTRRLLKPGASLVCDYFSPDPRDATELDVPWNVVGIVFGQGDGGHGPTAEEVHRMRYFIQKGYVKGFLTAREYFELYESIRDRLPVWNGAELYYNLHRGTLTTQCLVKRMNRYFEWNLAGLQSFFAHKEFIGNEQDDSIHAIFTRLWKDTILLQFHDILPGSSVPEVYDDCYDIWVENANVVENLVNRALAAGNSEKTGKLLPGNYISVLNMSSYEGIIPVELPITGEQVGIVDDGGPEPGNVVVEKIVFIDGSARLPLQFLPAIDLGEPLIDEPPRCLFTPRLGQWAVKNLPIKELDGKDGARVDPVKLDGEDCRVSVMEDADGIGITSPHCIVRFSKKDGRIISYRDKRLGRDILRGPAGPAVFRDWFTTERAWNIGAGYKECPFEPDEFLFEGLRVFELGPVRWAVEARYSIPESASTFQIRYQVYELVPGLHVEMIVDWKQEHAIAKQYYPFAADGDKVVAEGPYTTEFFTKDPAKRNRLEAQRWEACCHSWVAFPSKDDDWGIAYVNDSKYGFDVDKDTLGITLVRGPDYPNATGYVIIERERRSDGGPPKFTDQEKHLIRHVILPYEGSWREGRLQKFAHVFNAKPRARVNPPDNLPDNVLLGLDISPANLELVAMKRPERERDRQDALVIRVVENARKRTRGTIFFVNDLKVKDVKYLDLLERVSIKKSIKVKRDQDGFISSIESDWNPHEVLTFKILKVRWLKDAKN